MEFTTQDIKQLYGTYFFVLPETDIDEETTSNEVTEIAVEGNSSSEISSTNTTAPAPVWATEGSQNKSISSESSNLYHEFFMEGELVNWKMKPQTQLVLILQQKEFSDRSLTASLKNYIVEAGIPINVIGFGVIPDEAKKLNCSDMKPDVGVVFQLFGKKLPSPMEINGKSLFAVADLALINSKPAFQKRLVQILQQAYQRTQS